jgi:hypothetical protein
MLMELKLVPEIPFLKYCFSQSVQGPWEFFSLIDVETYDLQSMKF